MFDFLFGPFKLLMKDLPFIWISCCLFPLHSVHSQVPWTALETCSVEVCGFLPDFSPALSHPSRRAAHTKRHQVHHFATASNFFFQARSVAGLLERLSSSSPQPECKPAHSPPLPLDEQLCFSNHRNFSNTESLPSFFPKKATHGSDNLVGRCLSLQQNRASPLHCSVS